MHFFLALTLRFRMIIGYDVCFGHFHFSSLNYLARKMLVFYLSIVNITDCIWQICLIGKTHRDPFPMGRS